MEDSNNNKNVSEKGGDVQNQFNSSLNQPSTSTSAPARRTVNKLNNNIFGDIPFAYLATCSGNWPEKLKIRIQPRKYNLRRNLFTFTNAKSKIATFVAKKKNMKSYKSYKKRSFCIHPVKNNNEETENSEDSDKQASLPPTTENAEKEKDKDSEGKIKKKWKRKISRKQFRHHDIKIFSPGEYRTSTLLKQKDLSPSLPRKPAQEIQVSKESITETIVNSLSGQKQPLNGSTKTDIEENNNVNSILNNNVGKHQLPAIITPNPSVGRISMDNIQIPKRLIKNPNENSDPANAKTPVSMPLLQHPDDCEKYSAQTVTLQKNIVIENGQDFHEENYSRIKSHQKNVAVEHEHHFNNYSPTKSPQIVENGKGFQQAEQNVYIKKHTLNKTNNAVHCPQEAPQISDFTYSPEPENLSLKNSHSLETPVDLSKKKTPRFSPPTTVKTHKPILNPVDISRKEPANLEPRNLTNTEFSSIELPRLPSPYHSVEEGTKILYTHYYYDFLNQLLDMPFVYHIDFFSVISQAYLNLDRIKEHLPPDYKPGLLKILARARNLLTEKFRMIDPNYNCEEYIKILGLVGQTKEKICVTTNLQKIIDVKGLGPIDNHSPFMLTSFLNPQNQFFANLCNSISFPLLNNLLPVNQQIPNTPASNQENISSLKIPAMNLAGAPLVYPCMAQPLPPPPYSLDNLLQSNKKVKTQNPVVRPRSKSHRNNSASAVKQQQLKRSLSNPSALGYPTKISSPKISPSHNNNGLVLPASNGLVSESTKHQSTLPNIFHHNRSNIMHENVDQHRKNQSGSNVMPSHHNETNLFPDNHHHQRLPTALPNIPYYNGSNVMPENVKQQRNNQSKPYVMPSHLTGTNLIPENHNHQRANGGRLQTALPNISYHNGSNVMPSHHNETNLIPENHHHESVNVSQAHNETMANRNRMYPGVKENGLPLVQQNRTPSLPLVELLKQKTPENLKAKNNIQKTKDFNPQPSKPLPAVIAMDTSMQITKEPTDVPSRDHQTRPDLIKENDQLRMSVITSSNVVEKSTEKDEDEQNPEFLIWLEKLKKNEKLKEKFLKQMGIADIGALKSMPDFIEIMDSDDDEKNDNKVGILAVPKIESPSAKSQQPQKPVKKEKNPSPKERSCPDVTAETPSNNSNLNKARPKISLSKTDYVPPIPIPYVTNNTEQHKKPIYSPEIELISPVSNEPAFTYPEVSTSAKKLDDVAPKVGEKRKMPLTFGDIHNDYHKKLNRSKGNNSHKGCSYATLIPNGKLCYVSERHMFLRYHDNTQMELFVKNLENDKELINKSDINEIKKAYKHLVDVGLEKADKTEIISIPNHVEFTQKEFFENVEEYIVERQLVDDYVPKDFARFYEYVTGFQIVNKNPPVSLRTFLTMYNTNRIMDLLKKFLMEKKQVIYRKSLETRR